MSIKDAPIGFIDSGIGGVTVLKEALKIMPNESFVFISDSKNNPYGDKTDEEIISRCDYLVGKLIEDYGIKAVTLACNTASAKAAQALRQNYTLPIIAIEPAYKMVHDMNPDGYTLVMATRGTIESEKFHRLFYKYNNDKTDVISCVGMADLIEQDRQKDLEDYLENLLSKYKGKVENVVLGCTHYPLAKESILKVLGDVQFFDGANGTSRQLRNVLAKDNILSYSKGQGNLIFIDTSNNPEEKKQRFYEILARYNNDR